MRDFSMGNEARAWTTPSPKDRKGPKIRWSNELLEGVAREEARLSLEGCKKLNIELSKLYPNRTLEAIKGMRRLPKYRARVAHFLMEDNLPPPHPVRDGPASPCARERDGGRIGPS